MKRRNLIIGLILLAVAVFVPTFLRIGWAVRGYRGSCTIVLKQGTTEDIKRPYTAAEESRVRWLRDRKENAISEVDRLKAKYDLYALEQARIDTTIYTPGISWPARRSDAAGVAVGFIGVVVLIVGVGFRGSTVSRRGI